MRKPSASHGQSRKEHKAAATQKNLAHRFYNAMKDLQGEIKNLQVEILHAGGVHSINVWLELATEKYHIVEVRVNMQAEYPDRQIVVTTRRHAKGYKANAPTMTELIAEAQELVLINCYANRKIPAA